MAQPLKALVWAHQAGKEINGAIFKRFVKQWIAAITAGLGSCRTRAVSVRKGLPSGTSDHLLKTRYDLARRPNLEH